MAQSKESSTKSTSESLDDLISKLPRREGWTEPLFLYKNYWFRRFLLERIMLARESFKARHDDTILATNPKCGTTWLKALAFTITNRSLYNFNNHPLLTRHPHEVVKTIEVVIPMNGDLTSIEELRSPRLLSTHLPPSLLPESIAIHGCRIVYICRDPKDSFVSGWHFFIEVDGGKVDIHVAFNMFCEGVSHCGPFWDHCLEYWKESIAKPNRVLFVKYEEVMSDTVKFVKRLASFLGDPFTGEEEDAGVPEEVMRLCSFKTLSEVGGWASYISEEMGKKLDDIMEEKLKGSGLVL
ncbi:hypothetical protein EJB05_00659, partial [Eragrostis curvula]